MPATAVAIHQSETAANGLDPVRRQAALASFDERGESVAAWAKDRGYNPQTVRKVLAGRLKAKRGISHRIAVDLGIKLGATANER